MNVSATPETDRNATIRFVAAYRPVLKAGEYDITLEQAITVPGGGERFVHRANFAVSGERFVLDPAEIASVYPPQGAEGDFFKVLPHAVITRRTLPWERALFPEVSGLAAGAPWLAVLVFDAADGIADPQPMTVADLVAPGVHAGGRLPAKTISYAGLGRLEAGERYEDACLVLDLDLAAFRRIAPDAADIGWLAHGRTAAMHRKAAGGAAAEAQDHAVVVAGRLPRMGVESRACLVSLEGLGAWLPGVSPPDGAIQRIRLACLATWRFRTRSELLTFEECVAGLSRGPLRQPPAADPPIEAVAGLGYVPLPHRERDGGLAVSWYRGPLLPQAVPRTVTLPLDSADAALIEDPATGLLDVSYAAAWQAGRLIALQDRAFSTALYRWKLATRRDAVAIVERDLLGQRLGMPPGSNNILVGAAAWMANRLAGEDYGTRISFSPPPASFATVPPALIEWLARLRLLKGVPFSYLVTSEAMLPAESIRFFHLDANWLDCLVDGAYSLGRFTTGDRVQDDVHAAGLHGAAEAAKNTLRGGQGAAGDAGAATGFLLHSRAASFWPGMEAEAFDAAGARLGLLRFETLSPNLMIAIFEGVAETVVLHEPAEAIHFGLDVHLAAGTVTKKLRGVEADVTVPFRPGGQVVEVARLAEEIAKRLGGTPTTAEFAREMIENVGRVTFRQGSTA